LAEITIFEFLLFVGLEIIERQHKRAGRTDDRQQLEIAREIVDHETAAEHRGAPGRDQRHERGGQHKHGDAPGIDDAGATLALVDAHADHQHQHGPATEYKFRQDRQQVVELRHRVHWTTNAAVFAAVIAWL
jgi:hypothetical protein